jgi:hypothetical protein
MNRFSILKTVTLAFFCFVFLAVNAQQFDKDWAHQMIRQSLENKVKLSDTQVQEGLRLLQQGTNAPETTKPTSPVLSSRSNNDALSNSEETESEIHAAVNPLDSNNIIVGAMKFSAENILASLTFPIYYTKDFGSTWQLSEFNGTNDMPALTLVAGGGDPIIVFDDEGKAYLSWLTLSIGIDLKIKAELHWAISDDGGATWTKQPNPIDEGELADIAATAGKLPDKEWMASDLSNSEHRGNVYVAYAYINSTDTTYNILVKTKDADSETFGAAVDVNPQELAFAQFTSIDVDAKGIVHVMFGGATVADEVLSLYHVFSEDGGATFSEPVKISSLHLQCFPPGQGECGVVGIDPNRMYPCPHLRVDKSGGPNDGNLYAVWTADGITDQKTEGLDIYYAKSEDRGQTWSEPMILNDNTDEASHQFFPSLDVNRKGNLVVTWYDRRNDANNEFTDYYMTISRDGGNTFEPDFPVSTEASDFAMIGQANGNFGVGEYTQVITTDGYALPFWADGRTNDGNIEVFTSLIPLAQDQTTNVNDVIAISSPLSIQSVFPNPVHDIANVDIRLREPMQIQAKLFSNDGKVQRAYPAWNFGSGAHRLQLDVRGIAAGTYWLAIRSAHGMRTKAIVIE